MKFNLLLRMVSMNRMASLIKITQKIEFFFQLTFVVKFLIMITSGYAGDNNQDQKENRQNLTFEKNIRPIVEQHCLRCHKGRFFAQGGFRLENLKTILKGGDSGPAVISRQAKSSLLIKRLTANSEDPLRMPPPGNPQLSSDDIQLIIEWIDGGVH